eukprot:gene4237-5305_t
MGTSLSRIFNDLVLYFKDECKILLVGLDNAGKTTILSYLKFGELIGPTSPTVGCNVETLGYKSMLKFQIVDRGGGSKAKIEDLWDQYFNECKGLIYVIDSSDDKRINEAANELNSIINNQSFSKGDHSIRVPVLILCNKQDKKNAKHSKEITKQLNLHLQKDLIFHIEPCSAFRNFGINEGMEWLANAIITHEELLKEQYAT